MKKTLFTFLFCITLFTTHTSFAQNTKVITLKNGTVVKGNITSLKNNIYTVQTENLGVLSINDTDIVNITAESLYRGQTQNNNINVSNSPLLNTNAQNNPLLSSGILQNPQIMNQAQQLLSNPQLLNDIQNLMSDPQLMQLFSDPNLLNELMSMDQSRIENNPKFNELINNPQVQALIEKIQASGLGR